MKKSLLISAFLLISSQAALADHRMEYSRSRQPAQTQEQKPTEAATATAEIQSALPNEQKICDMNSKDQECCPTTAQLTEEQKSFREANC